MAENNNKRQKNSKKTKVEFRGEAIGGKCPKSMYKAILPFFLEAITEMYEKDKKKHDKLLQSGSH